jgi:hypothetical protein
VQYETRYMKLCCNFLPMLQILQIRLPITSLFEKRRHTVTPTHFCLNFPLSLLHLPQSCDILIPGPFSYTLSQLHRLFFVCYQLHSRLLLCCFIMVIFIPSTFHRKTKDICLKEQGQCHQLVIYT